MRASEHTAAYDADIDLVALTVLLPGVKRVIDGREASPWTGREGPCGDREAIVSRLLQETPSPGWGEM